MHPSSKLEEDCRYLAPVKWPEDLLGPNYWVPKASLLWDLPKELKEQVGRVTDSGKRFYQKVKHQPAPMIFGDKDVDPDAVHALLFALDRQEELGNGITAAKEHSTESLMLWLQERKKSHVRSMQAVVIAEEGEMYDEANKEPWEGKLSKMTNEHVEYLRFIFRTVMARIDTVRTKAEDVEIIQPTYKEAIVKLEEGAIFSLPNAPSVSFWKIDESLNKDAPLKMCQALLALYHQGRVLSAGWANLPLTKQKHFTSMWAATVRAMTLTIRHVDLVWIERRKGLPKEEEERLLAWLQAKKDAAADLRLSLVRFQLSPKFDGRTVKFDNSGNTSVLENGEYLGAGQMFLL